jgi:catechol 2,3-dioxygenase-like lactoylglutathione lyase family enzyme
MKRLHVHVGVADLDQSILFYSTLFGAEPSVAKPDYAKWMLDDPRVNFAISSGRHAAKGIEHLGIQAENESELAEVFGRLKAADRPVLEEGRTTCCYARSEKAWIADPDGVVWEAFFTDGEATVYGDSPALASLATAEADTACCDAETPQGLCCEPKAELPADAPCCGPAT